MAYFDWRRWECPRELLAHFECLVWTKSNCTRIQWGCEKCSDWWTYRKMSNFVQTKPGSDEQFFCYEYISIAHFFLIRMSKWSQNAIGAFPPSIFNFSCLFILSARNSIEVNNNNENQVLCNFSCFMFFQTNWIKKRKNLGQVAAWVDNCIWCGSSATAEFKIYSILNTQTQISEGHNVFTSF